jgi:hypothetical protein
VQTLAEPVQTLAEPVQTLAVPVQNLAVQTLASIMVTVTWRAPRSALTIICVAEASR